MRNVKGMGDEKNKNKKKEEAYRMGLGMHEKKIRKRKRKAGNKIDLTYPKLNIDSMKLASNVDYIKLTSVFLIFKIKNLVLKLL